MRKNCVFEIKVDFKVEIHELPWNQACFQNMTELFVKVDFNFPWFKVKTFSYFSRKVTRSHYKYYFCVEFLDGGKWKQHFPVFFFGKTAQFMNFMGVLIFPFKREGRVSRHPRSAKAGIIHWKLYVNKHATCDFKISSPVTVS